MKKRCLPLFILLFVSSIDSIGQGVGVNTTGVQPNASSMLDVNSTDKGMLVPRLALSATNVAAPVTAPATSLLVFNTATAGSGGTAVTPGYYFWNGTEWERLVSGSVAGGSDDQNLTGATLTGTNLQIDIENGSSTSVDLSSLQDGTGTDDQNLTGATLTGTNLQIDIENGSSASVDLSSLQDGVTDADAVIGNEYNTSLTLTGNDLNLTDGGGTLTVDLSSLSGGGGTNDDWKLLGNAGTTPGTHFLGTTDDQDIVFKRNNVEMGWLNDRNIALGQNAILNRPNGTLDNVAIGTDALRNVTWTGRRNTALGANSMKENTSGSDNVAIGFETMQDNTSGDFNVAIGKSVMKNSTTMASHNVGIGANALNDCAGNNNVAIGQNTMVISGSGFANVAIGHEVLNSNTSGFHNVGIGKYALWKNEGGDDNVAIGAHTLQANTTGNYNVALGRAAMNSNESGHRNVALGYSSLTSNLDGDENVAVGYYALDVNTTGDYNVAVGTSSLYQSTSSERNTAIGYSAMWGNTTGHDNVAVGANSGTGTDGEDNVAIGVHAKAQYQYGIAIGAQASAGWGNGNTVVGRLARIGSSVMITNSCAFGRESQVSAGSSGTYTNSTAIGYGAQLVNVSNKMRLGNTAVTDVETENLYTTVSDGRFKNSIQENVPGLAFVTQLRPVTYHFDVTKRNEFLGVPDSLVDHEAVAAGEAKLRTGFIAQEIEEAAQQLGYDFDGVVAPTSTDGYYCVSYTQLVVPLVKAVQEQQALIEATQQENEQFRMELQELKKELKALKK